MLVGLTEEALELARRQGDRVVELAWLSASIGNLLALGSWDEALELAAQLQATQDLDSFEWAIGSYLEIVPLLVRRGELSRAERRRSRSSGSASPKTPTSGPATGLLWSSCCAPSGSRLRPSSARERCSTSGRGSG